MQRFRLITFMGIIALLTSFIALVTPTQAAPRFETYKNERTGRCLDGFGTDPSKGTIKGTSCEGTATQYWQVQRNDNGTVTLINKQTGLCLDSNHSGEAYTHACGGDYQHWRVLRNDNGSITFKSRVTGLCLDTNSTNNVYTLKCNGGSHQRWF